MLLSMWRVSNYLLTCNGINYTFASQFYLILTILVIYPSSLVLAMTPICSFIDSTCTWEPDRDT